MFWIAVWVLVAIGSGFLFGLAIDDGDDEDEG